MSRRTFGPTQLWPVALGWRRLAFGMANAILVDRQGRLGFAFNTERMSRAWIDADGREGVGFR